MKKFSIALVIALAAVLSAAGCGNKANTNKLNKTDAKSAPQESAQEQLENYGKNASDNADMSMVDGKKLNEAKTEGNSENNDKIGGYQVKIEEAKVVDYGEEKAVLLSFSFKNDTASDVSFAGVMNVTAEQDGGTLPPVVVTGVDGYDSSTLAQNVSKGEKITVQRAYKLSDEENPIDVSVKAVDSANNAGEVKKTFEIK